LHSITLKKHDWHLLQLDHKTIDEDVANKANMTRYTHFKIVREFYLTNRNRLKQHGKAPAKANVKTNIRSSKLALHPICNL